MTFIAVLSTKGDRGVGRLVKGALRLRSVSLEERFALGKELARSIREQINGHEIDRFRGASFKAHRAWGIALGAWVTEKQRWNSSVSGCELGTKEHGFYNMALLR